MDIVFYGNDKPLEGELVMFKFTNRLEHSLQVELIDYDIKGTMTHNNATTKKKVKSWNQLAPLNKPIVGYVESVDTMVDLSMAYIDEKSKEYLEFIDVQYNNKVLKTMVKKFTNKINKNFNTFWEECIHKIDLQRNRNGILLQYLSDNLNLLDEYLNEDEKLLFINLLNDIKETKNLKFKSKIGLISLDGVTNIKETVTKVINNHKNITLRLDATPNYFVYSNNEEENKLFINELKNNLDSNRMFLKIY